MATCTYLNNNVRIQEIFFDTHIHYERTLTKILIFTKIMSSLHRLTLMETYKNLNFCKRQKSKVFSTVT